MAQFTHSLCEEVIRTQGKCGLTRNEMVQLANLALRVLKPAGTPVSERKECSYPECVRGGAHLPKADCDGCAPSSAGLSIRAVPEEPSEEVLAAICKWMAWPADCTLDASELYRAIYMASSPPSATEAFTTEVCDELFGSFARHAGGKLYLCTLCDEPIPMDSWVHAPHNPHCIIPRVREYLAKHKPECVPSKDATVGPTGVKP